MKKVLNFLKKGFFILFLCTFLLAFFYYDLLIYGLGQGIGQFNILWNVQNVEEFKQQKKGSKEELAKLDLIEDIKKYAIDSLKLNGKNNYNTIYDQKGKAILWVLAASKPYELKSIDWDYGFLGKMSYRGFFKKKNAERLLKKLKAKGYDVEMREVSAWSTLGWFKDPILTSMLKRSEGSLASLIIHELTHSTIWITGNITYNENMADFIGDRGAVLFLKYKYGINSQEYQLYENAKIDAEKFYGYILKSAQGLDSLYANFDETLYKRWFLEQLQKKVNNMETEENSFAKGYLEKYKAFQVLKEKELQKLQKNLSKLNFEYSLEEKEKLKKEYIQKIRANIDTVSFHQKERFIEYFKKYNPTNAFFMAFRTYREKQNLFEEECKRKFAGDIQKYILYLKEKY